VSISGICRLKVPVRQNKEKQWRKKERWKKVNKSDEVNIWSYWIILPHFQKQLPPLPAFSPPLGTQSEALSDGFLHINRPSRINYCDQAF